MSSPAPPLDLARVKQWWAKSRWYRRASRPWNRALLEVELARREAFARGTVHGDWLPMLREGRLEIGPQAFFEPGVWLTGGPNARIVIGGGTFLNLGVMVAAEQLVEIGEHVLRPRGRDVLGSVGAGGCKRAGGRAEQRLHRGMQKVGELLVDYCKPMRVQRLWRNGQLKQRSHKPCSNY